MMHLLRLSLILMAVAPLAGCNIIGYVAQGVTGDKDPIAQYEAQYRGLEGKTFAVFVTTDSKTLYDSPTAPRQLSQAVSRKILRYVENSTATGYQKIQDYETANPYWQFNAYHPIYEKLDIDRLVHVELLEFTTHEPGNEQVWQGTAVARVCISEAENEDPNNATFCQTVNTQFPADRPVGLLDSDKESIQKGLIVHLSSKIVNLFRDYEEVQSD